MKPSDKRISSCLGKKRFPTFGQAERTAHRQAQKRKEKFRAYACSLCAGFHVGTTLGEATRRGMLNPVAKPGRVRREWL
jgi:hypothetical protein